MAIPLKQSTASQEVLLGPFVDDTDGKTAETGLTIANTDIKIWKAGGTTEASKNSGGATHIAGGRYYTVLDATDTDTLGPLEINVHVSGALPVRRECLVLAANVYDALIAGSDKLQVHADEMTAGLITASAIATGAIDADAIAADAVTEMQSGLATSAALATVDTVVDAIKVVTDVLPDSGALTSLATQASVNTIDDFLDTEIAAIVGYIDTEVSAILALLDDARSEPGQGAPPVNPDLATKVDYLYKAFRNKITQTSDTLTIYADDGTTADHKATVSDDATTYTRGELVSGA